VTSQEIGGSSAGRGLAEAYLSNVDNRAAFDRLGIFSTVASEASDGMSAVDFLIGGGYERYAEAELDELAAAWEPYLSRPVRRVLDAGCGAGVTTLALARRYQEAEAVGVDVEKSALDLARYLARDEGRCAFRQQPLERFSDTKTFEIIQCRCVLEHVDEPRHVLHILIRYLSPGGVLYVETPNYLFPWEPHIEMPMLPKSPKWLLAAQCRLSGKDPSFVRHLNLSCDPIHIRRWASNADPSVMIIDLMAQKAAAIFESDETRPRVASRARLVDMIKRFPALARIARWGFTHLPVAPNVIFLVAKASR
jgi:2-polyprenyl-3-methyl-5-hydroxy-6-metoxy-1,4-benzoquinol methylase